jgi:DNA-binding IclR family transcriptional regulator
VIPFPAALDAYDDPRLHRTERRLYRVALTSLDLQSYRPLKLSYLRHKTGLAITHLCTARKTLTDLGYLERRGNAYRLTLSRPENAQPYTAA